MARHELTCAAIFQNMRVNNERQALAQALAFE